MKLCRNCRIEKDEKDFYKTKSKSYPDSHLHQCKSCIKEYRKEKRVYSEKPVFKVENKELTLIFD